MNKKAVALVAHDNKKPELLAWAQDHISILEHYDIYATGTTGKMLETELNKIKPITVYRMQSGPLGGDQQIGAKIVEGAIDFLIFFWDPLEPQPHDPDVKALLRIAVTWDIPFACNRATANFIFASGEATDAYVASRPNFDTYLNRNLKK